MLYSRPVPHQQTHQQDPVTTTKFHHILPIKDNSTPSTFALSAPCLGWVTTGHLPYSTKWGGPTPGLVPLILYSRPVPHQQTHQQDPVTSTKFHHILPIKDNSTPSTFALSAPCLGLVTSGHLPYSTKWGGPTLGRGPLILYSMS